ncbi:MAG: cobalamin B12-binding domain-containing protein [Deltaproteobacteria bacterium]|nr:cobalamin B12-binding domain-containing protein [Deltaproteobacteria bacterium]
MRILFISPNRLRLVVPPLPLGLASVVAAVKNEYEVRVLDFMFADDPLGQVRRAVIEFSPDVIALSVRNIDNQDSRNPESYISEVKDLVHLLKELSAAPVVVGGAGFSIMPREFMEYLEADFGVAGEGEGAFREFLSASSGSRDWETVSGLAWRQGDTWRLNPVQRVADLKSLPAPALEYFTPDLYQEAQGSAKLPGMVPVQTRRGCPMKCIYCTTPLLEGRRFRAWEPGQIASWLAAWHEKWGLTRFYFVDNLFNCPPSYAKSLCRAILDLNLPLEWGALLNPAAPDRELFRFIRQAGGAFMQVGNESGSELVLTKLGKGFGRRQVELTFRLLEEEGISYSCFLLLGGPGETPETVKESVALLEQYRPQMVNLTVGVRIYPGLALHRQALEEGVVAPKDNLLRPRFYLAPAIREWIWEYLEGVTARHPNWIF